MIHWLGHLLGHWASRTVDWLLHMLVRRVINVDIEVWIDHCWSTEALRLLESSIELTIHRLLNKLRVDAQRLWCFEWLWNISIPLNLAHWLLRRIWVRVKWEKVRFLHWGLCLFRGFLIQLKKVCYLLVLVALGIREIKVKEVIILLWLLDRVNLTLQVKFEFRVLVHLGLGSLNFVLFWRRIVKLVAIFCIRIRVILWLG